MKRICECDNVEMGSVWTGTQCRPCWLFYHSNAYRQLWEGEGPAIPIVKGKEKRARTVKEERMKEEQQYPSLLQQAKNVAEATATWITAGRPVRSEEEQIRILEICKACVKYDEVQIRCRACGCGLAANSSVGWVKHLGVVNAVAMASHSCPEKKW